jgi:Domain of unknown function (DUF4382)
LYRKILAALTIILGASASMLYLYYASSHVSLSVMDPPPTQYDNSISAIYINLTEIDIHAANAGNNSGWHTISTATSLNLLSIIGTSRLLGTTVLPPGRYSEIRFFTSQAIITISGTNTTYTIPSGNQNGIKVQITGGGFHVYGGQTVAVQLDLSFNNNEIINNPNKTLNPVASATVV